MRGILFDILEINIGISVVILITLLFTRKLRKRYGAGWMKILWLLLAVRLAIPYNFSLPFMEIRLLNRPGFEQETDDGRVVSELQGEEDGDASGLQAGESGGESAGAQQTDASGGEGAGVQQAGESGGEGAGVQQAGESGGENAGAQQADTIGGKDADAQQTDVAVVGDTAGVLGETVSGSGSYVDIMLFIWLAGIGVCLLYVFTGYLFFYRKCRKSIRPLKNKKLAKQIIMIQKNVIGKVQIPAYQSFYVTSPMMIGIFKPKLVIPVSGKTWNRRELELVMEHELCHFKSKDLIWKFFMTMVWCVNWFNPAVLVLKKQFFYDMELACDEKVLKTRNEKEREAYARIVLAVAGNGRRAPAFSTGFTEDKKRMADRIDHIFDKRSRKKGVGSILAAGMLILLMSVVVSCGYRSEEERSDVAGADTADRDSADGEGLQGGPQEGRAENNAGNESEDTSGFDYNHQYNEMIRVYGEDVYVAREEGIYLVEGGTGEERLLFANDYNPGRGMEVYSHYLFFCGSADSEDEEAATIYRLDLNTKKVTDALADHSRVFKYLHTISVYEDNLYVAEGGFGHRTGFVLTIDGEIGEELDESADDFLYKETNEYVELTMQMINASYDSEEYRSLAEKEAGMYQPLADVVACKKLLHGSWVVSRYKDEACREAYLEHEDGTFEYLCDIYNPYDLVTETGLYYLDEVSGDILYVDFETKRSKTIYKQPEDWAQICLCTYDEDYIYLTTNNLLGFDEEDNSLHKICLQRIPRQGGDIEEIYQFEEGIERRMPWNFFGHCGVYGEDMYSEEYGTISLNL